MSMDKSSDDYLVVCSYAIALLEFVSAALFAIISAVLYINHKHCTYLLAMVFSIIWICIILVLLTGIYFRRLDYVRYWLVFTCLGIMLDAIFLLYGLTLSVRISWDGAKITLLPFIGLAVEMTFVYIIYVFYINMIENELWIPVCQCRVESGFSTSNNCATPTSYAQHRMERKLKKMRKRDERIATRELQRKLLRSEI